MNDTNVGDLVHDKGSYVGIFMGARCIVWTGPSYDRSKNDLYVEQIRTVSSSITILSKLTIVSRYNDIR